MRAALLLIGGVVLVLVVLKVAALVLMRRSVETLDFRGPVRALEIAVGAGEVTIRGSGRTDARVRRTIRHGLRRPRINEAVDDGVLRLHVSSGVVQYEVDIPRHAAIIVRTGAASATVIGVTGTVELRAAAGSIEGRALDTPSVHASTSAGSIRLSFDRPPADVEVATSEGSVDLMLPDGPYDVEARGSLGQTRVGVRCDAHARHRVRAHSSAGSVSIHSR